MILNNKIKLFFLCLLLVSCQTGNKSVDQNNDSQLTREIKPGLTLSNSTLEQSNPEGEILWRLKTEKTTYSPDQKIAILEKMTANLFDNDKLILQISADKGELKNGGKQIYLEENIIVVDPRNEAELRGEEVIWLPEENIMTMTGEESIKVSHAKLVVLAQQGKYNTKSQVLELEKDIIATTSEPSLQLKTQHLYWQIEENKVIGNERLDIVRYEDKIVTDRLKTDQIQIDLETNIAIVNGNIEYQSFQPLLQAAATKITWFYIEREMESNQAITLVQPKQGTTITANQGKFNLTNNQVNLEGGIYGKTTENQAQLYANSLNWNLNNQQINAYGNVYYQQLAPDLKVTGKSAKGNLKNKNITVEGNSNNRVTSTIYAN